MTDWQNVEIAPPSPKHINDPKHWRDRAEAARAKAELMNDAQARETMYHVAEEYDHLERQAEAASKEAARWRGRADSIRVRALQMTSVLSAEAMKQVAEDFEFLAEYAEQPRRLAL
jgi:pyruvate-formate lyase